MNYVEAALALAEYSSDEDGVVIASVPGVPGCFTQGDTRAEAEVNLRDVIEGNLLLAHRLGLPIPSLPDVGAGSTTDTP